MRQDYNKLVRDRIPEIIAADGKTCEVSVLDDPAFGRALATKLVEEAQEVGAAMVAGNRAETVKELADILEVIDALLAQQGIDLTMVRHQQAERRQARGGFAQRLLLHWVEPASE